MYIDTRSRERMEKSICEIFLMHPCELQEQLIMIGRSACDEAEYIHKLNLFISENATEYPNEILLFHLSRRLRDTEDETEGYNLADLLLSENSFSEFMKRYGIEFIKGDQHIDVIYKGRLVDWDKCQNGNSSYMKSRLGYFKDQEDFCFNGFAMKDLLYRNSYARALSNAPEFLGELVQCLQCEEIVWEYMDDSEYFCYEYKLPMSIVIFDGHDDYSDDLKQRYLLRCILQRLYQYQVHSFMFDYDNPVLRLADNYTIPGEYYIGREKITSKMMSY